jgi:hypothetical protein
MGTHGGDAGPCWPQRRSGRKATAGAAHPLPSSRSPPGRPLTLLQLLLAPQQQRAHALAVLPCGAPHPRADRRPQPDAQRAARRRRARCVPEEARAQQRRGRGAGGSGVGAVVDAAAGGLQAELRMRGRGGRAAP